jgi:hypothetical protein
MGTVHITVIIVGALLLLGVAYEVMSRLNRTAIREHERRREEWKAAGLEGPSPGEGLSSGSSGGGG